MGIVELLCASVVALSLGDTPQNAEFACKNMSHLATEAEKNELDPALLVSLIHHESRWVPTVVSKSNACGLTQVIPKWTGGRASNHQKYTCDQLKDATTSITAGATILSFWIESYGRGNVKTGLCGYNAGYRCKGENPNAAGMRYSKKVRKTHRRILRHISKLRKQHGQ